MLSSIGCECAVQQQNNARSKDGGTRTADTGPGAEDVATGDTSVAPDTNTAADASTAIDTNAILDTNTVTDTNTIDANTGQDSASPLPDGSTIVDSGSADSSAVGCRPENPVETFGGTDQPTTISVASYSFATPWGYSKPANTSRNYPLVVHGCWGEGYLVGEATKKSYPAFYLTYQKCDSDSEGADLSALLDTAVGQGLRIDLNRVYLTGWSKGGSGSYKLVRGYLSRGKLFAAIIRIAGQSQTVLPDEAIAKTSIWYHIGLLDTATRVQVATDAYDFVKNHADNATAVESASSGVVSILDTSSGVTSTYQHTTKTLTKSGVEIMKLTQYPAVGHDAKAQTYNFSGLFDWLFGQSLLCR